MNSRFLNMLLFLAIVHILLSYSGFPTTTSFMVQHLNILNPESIINSSLIVALGLAVLGATAGGIIIGYLGRWTPDMIFMGAMAGIAGTTLFTAAGDIALIYTYLKDTNQMLAVLICSPMIVAWFICVVDWWGRRD